MPVRIYDIAKKLGLENKYILTKAKELGIAAARVASSSLDKISAEWLEEELIKGDPALAARLAPKPPEEKPKPAPVEEKIVIISAPEPPPEVKPEPAPVVEMVEPVIAAEPAPVSETVETPPTGIAPIVPAPVIPVEPPKPKVGDKVGFIVLPTRPSSRPGF